MPNKPPQQNSRSQEPRSGDEKKEDPDQEFKHVTPHEHQKERGK